MKDKPSGATSISVDEARVAILAAMPLVGSETVGLDDALGRVLAKSVTARLSSPPFDVSAMDGYAVRAADVAAGTVLPVAGESRAGLRAVPTLAQGATMRIFTGAPVPVGADAIVIQENAAPAGAGVRFTTVAERGLNIRHAGLNFHAGAELLPQGRVLSARDIGLMAGAGHADVAVSQRPRIALLSTGDELSADAADAQAGQVRDSNRPALKALIRSWGGVPVDLGIAGDRDAAIRGALVDVRADMLVITGGASVGDHDRVRPALASLGLRFDFWKIRMRPGKPLMFGALGDMPVLGVPGNPVSAVVCALLFLQPAIAKMSGAAAGGPVFENIRLAKAIAPTGDRDDYLRATVTNTDGELEIEAFAQQDSAMLSVLAKADALIFRPAHAPAAAGGERVKAIRFEGGF